MRTLVKLVIAIVLTGAAWLVAANSHLDIFPCRITKSAGGGYTGFGHEPRRETRSGSCSVMYVTSDYGGTSSSYEMKPEGWALAVVVLTLVPFALVFGIGAAVGKKKKPHTPPA